ncbi:MAG TPA: sialate O-acetylesterase, partial [Planctomycetota bacterium]|nr:sialate O-acetylesterase [Planctomycetota bacterium]
MKMIRTILVAVLIGFLSLHALANVKPASLFTDNAVLQQGIKVPVWGDADPGEKVTVTFDGKSVSATSDKAGKWK